MQLPPELALARDRRYQRVGREIASGGYGDVFIASDVATQQMVIVKRQPVADPAAAREFAVLSVLSQHRHDHIVSMLDSYVDKGLLYLVFELFDVSLGSLARNTPVITKGCVESARVAKYMAGVVKGSIVDNPFGLEGWGDW